MHCLSMEAYMSDFSRRKVCAKVRRKFAVRHEGHVWKACSASDGVAVVVPPFWRLWCAQQRKETSLGDQKASVPKQNVLADDATTGPSRQPQTLQRPGQKCR